MKKIVKIPLIVAASLLGLLVIAQLLVSPVVKSYLNSHGEQLMGRKIGVEKLFINLLNTSVRARGITIYEADGQQHFVTCGEFSTRVRLFPMLAKEFIVARISLDSLTARLIQDGERFNFDDILAHFASEEESAPASEPSGWGVGIYNIGLHNASLLYKDISMGGKWDMENITLDIPGFYFSSEKTDAGLQLDFPDGGSLSSQIEYDYADGTYDLAVSLREFTVAGLLPYAKQYMNLSSLDGLLGGDVKIKGRTDNALDFDLRGRVWLRGFELKDLKERQVAAADSVTVTIDRIDLLESQYMLSAMDIYGMKTHYEMYADSTHSFSDIIREDVAAAEEADSSQPVNFRIGMLAMHGGTVEVTDHTPHIPFHYRIGDIGVEASNIDMQSHCTLTARASLHGQGRLRVHWTGSPTDMSYHNLTIELHNVDMAHFSPYTLTMFGYPFHHGTLSFSGQNVIRNKRLEGTNHLDIHDPKLDKKTKEHKPQYNLPLRTGVYLLTDREGRMKMDLPVTGNVDSPEFSYRRIIVNAIVNTLIKVVTSPVMHLADAMGIASDKMGYIEFDPARVDFTSEQYDKMANLGKMLQDKPELKLSLSQGLNYDRALADEAVAQLKQAYFLSRNPGKAGVSLEMLENESAMAVDVKSPQLAQYADSLMTARSLTTAKTDLTSKAMAIYSQQAGEKLTERMQARNAMIANHFTKSLGLADSVFTVCTKPADSLRCHKGRDSYAVSLGLRDETL